MLSTYDYMSVVAYRIQSDGGQVIQAQIGPLQAWAGQIYKGAGPISQIHYCVVVAGLNEVNGFVVDDFSRQATQYANHTTNGIRGFGTAVVTLVGLVAPVVHPDAVQAATASPRADMGGTTRPVVVDLTSGQVSMFTGTQLLGLALQGMIKSKAQSLFPPPAAVEAEWQRQRQQQQYPTR